MPGEETIGSWTTSELVRFLEDTLRQNPPASIPTLTCENLTIMTNAIIKDQVQFVQRQTTVGAAGGATALPATPLGYFVVQDYTGASRAVPYYNVN